MKYSEVSYNIIEYLFKELEPYAILLFGSICYGSFRKDSDVDIAFLSEKEVSEYDLFIRSQYLAEKIGREIDLVDLKKASTVLKAQIIGRGMAIYIGNETKFAEFQIRALKEYGNLNDERAQVFDSIARRGRVYG